jgi:peptide-methionine (S)-S-oxide reductase
LAISGVIIMAALAFLFGAFAGGGSAQAADGHHLPKPDNDLAPPAKPGETRTAVFAGGCFWCTEGAFEQFRGVKEVLSGYTGDTKQTATYEQVCSHTTNHAEAIKITYDPSVITYAQLLQIFFTAHDPTTLDRQGNDVGHQYRSAIFYQSDEEKRVAEAYIRQLDDAKVFASKIVTTLEPLNGFYPAEDYHQNYVANNPNQGYVRACALPKMQKVRKEYKDWLKTDDDRKAERAARQDQKR